MCHRNIIVRLLGDKLRNSRLAVHLEIARVELVGATRTPAHLLRPRRVLLAPLRTTRFAWHTLRIISISSSMIIRSSYDARFVGRRRLFRCGDLHACALLDADEACNETKLVKDKSSSLTHVFATIVYRLQYTIAERNRKPCTV